MNIPLILVVGMISIAHAATVRYDLNTESGQGQGDFHVTNPSVLESSSRPGIQNSKQVEIKAQSYRPQDLETGSPIGQDFNADPNLFQSQQLGLPTSRASAAKSSVKGQFNEISNHPDFYSSQQNIPNQQQLTPSRQQAPGQLPFYKDNNQLTGEQQFYNLQQQSFNQQQQLYSEQQPSPLPQQFFNDRQQSSLEQQQFYDEKQSSMEQEQLFNDKQQPLSEQQFYSEKQQEDIQRDLYNMQSLGGSEQDFNNKRRFQDVANQQVPIPGGKQLVQMHAISKGAVQLSAFNNRAQPIVISPTTAMHSASVVVSGLKNLPVLPSMVYNGGPVPVTHALVYGRNSLYKGGASIRQHLQTPYVRYVYSHTL